MAAANLGSPDDSSPTTEPRSKRVLHAAETALSVATDILTLVGDFTENVPYVNAVTGAINKLIEVKKEVDDNKERANVLVHAILDVSTNVAQALRDIPEKRGSDTRDALRPLVDDLKTYKILLQDANVILQNWLSDSRWKRIWNRGDFKSMADGIEYKLSKFREAFELKRLISLDVGQSALKAISEELAIGMESLIDDSTRVKLREWLNAADVGRNQKAAEDRHHPGTGKWFLEGTPEFQQWKYSLHSFLWLHGISGCGKTMLSSTIIKMLRDNGETVVYFYFDTTDDRKQKLEDLLCTLVSRLSECAPHAATILKGFWKPHASGADRPSNQALLGILRKILQGFTTPVYIVLDALDESSETEIVLDAITKIRDENISNVHLFLTSRTEITHGSGLFSLQTAVHLEGSGVAKDIESYVDYIIATDKAFRSWSYDVKNKIREGLVNSADPMFRLVALQLDQLRRCHYESDVDPALSTMPATMNGIYDRILAKSHSDLPMLAMVNRTLSWLIFSMRPMTLEEIIDALAVDFNESPLRFNPKKRIMAPSQLLDACASLVSQNTKDGRIILQLAHASVKEYLTDPKRSSRGLQAEISDYAGHYMIARTCIAYLCSFDDYDVLESSPLAWYAAWNWYHHVNRYNPGPSESHNNLVRLQTPRGHIDHFPPSLWSFWILLGFILQFFQVIFAFTTSLFHSTTSFFLFHIFPRLTNGRFVQGIYLREHDKEIRGRTVESRQERDSRDLIIALMELLNAASPQYTNLFRLRKRAFISSGDVIPPLALSADLGVLPAVRQLLERGADVNEEGGAYGNALYAASSQGHTKIVRELVERGANVNTQGGVDGTALQAASSRGHTETVRELLESGADVNVQGGSYVNALQAASIEGHTEIVWELLERGADVNAQGGLRYGSAMQAASSRGHTEIVRELLERGANVNAQGGEYGNALQAASDGGYTEIARELLERGAAVNTLGGPYGNALHAASSRGHIEIVQELLKRGADVNAPSGRYGNALQAASSGGHIKIVRMLLETGADVNTQGGRYGNALQAASLRGYIKIVQVLLERGADVNVQSGRYGYALQAASSQGNTEIVRVLLERGANVNAQGGLYGKAMQAATYKGPTEIVQELLNGDADVNAQGGFHGNALQAASSEGHTETVRELLDSGADVNIQGGRYANALQAASIEGHTWIVRELLERGADVNVRGRHNETLLQAASSRGYTDIVRELINGGADVNAQGGFYGNALQAASLGGYIESVQELLERGADVSAQGGEYGNALQAASLQGHSEIVRELLERGADVNAQGGEYGNALCAASFGRYTEIAWRLLERGADVNAHTGFYGNALQVASLGGYTEIVWELLERGADVNAQGGLYGNAMQAATYKGNTEIVQELLERGADVNAQGGRYGNALYAASSGGYTELVRELLERGADVNAQGGLYGSALRAASWGGHTEIVRELLERGANAL
ncbi:ankyrin repeat-containing domain protein, partial [Mycena vulgaris]